MSRLQVTFYEVVDHEGERLDGPPPWIDWMQTIDDLHAAHKIQTAANGDRLGAVFWGEKNREKARPHDVLLELAKERQMKPASSNRATGHIGAAPDIKDSRYSERTLATMVDRRVLAAILVGRDAARASSVMTYINEKAGLHQAPFRIRPIVSPRFVEELRVQGNVARKLSFRTTMSGLDHIYGTGERSVLRMARRMRQRDLNDVHIDVTMSLQSRKRIPDNMEPSEHEDAEALIEEARMLSEHTEDLMSGAIDILNEDGEKTTVQLTEARLTHKVNIQVDPESRWIDPGTALDRMIEAYGPYRGQVREMLGDA